MDCQLNIYFSFILIYIIWWSNKSHVKQKNWSGTSKFPVFNTFFRLIRLVLCANSQIFFIPEQYFRTFPLLLFWYLENTSKASTLTGPIQTTSSTDKQTKPAERHHETAKCLTTRQPPFFHFSFLLRMLPPHFSGFKLLEKKLKWPFTMSLLHRIHRLYLRNYDQKNATLVI